MAIDYTSNTGKTRLLIGDTVESYHFSDEEIQAFLSIYGNNIQLAGIGALETWATQLVSDSGDSYRLGDVEFDEGRSKTNQMLAVINDRKSAIANGLNPACLGIGIMTGIYQSDVNTNNERIAEGELVSPEVFKDTYDIIDYDTQEGPYY